MKFNYAGITGEAGQTPRSSTNKHEEPNQITAVAKAQSAEQVQLLEIGRRYNENMLVAGRTPEYLYKGMKEGKPIEELFMIAVRGVSACLGDPMLVKVMERGLAERRAKQEQEQGTA